MSANMLNTLGKHRWTHAEEGPFETHRSRLGEVERGHVPEIHRHGSFQ